ncbi:NAD(P)-dependent alcohol dehydrogenase [Streptomyces sp. SS7]|uniref:NAD(P)-dependent alcohol dehydrogenase n=1 Tax=Streptomyces sp. SS7 TaxID=3108485 RepID=UPI0030EC31D7
MEAIVYRKYGSASDVLRLENIDRPVPKAGEVLVRILSAAVNPLDTQKLRAEPYLYQRPATGLRRPRKPVLGGDVAGRVEAVGSGVTRFQPGDEVYGSIRDGGFAEYAAAPEDLLVHKPPQLSFDQAAALPVSGVTALTGLGGPRGVEPGRRVLVIGASGGVGTCAVQIAKAMGAEVTGVCSGRNAELVRSLGADHVIDYTKTDLTTTGRRYDVVLQAGGTDTASTLRRLATPKGTVVLLSGEASGRVVGPIGRVVKGLALSPFISQKVRALAVMPTASDLEQLSEVVAAGKLTPVIDRTYPLRDTADAMAYRQTGRARGKVVVRVTGAA